VRFWKGNRVDAGFDWPADAVADAFSAWYLTQPGDIRGEPLERTLRRWLCDKDGFNASWEAETGDDSFETVFELAYGNVFGAPGLR
jgi:hypothetical protein